MKLTAERLRALPKVLLHDHLDGGLRPATIVELARESGLALPSADPAELGRWFVRPESRGSLGEYLKGFQITTGVMQSETALHRVAYEAMEDLANDGVVYAEIRFAPNLHCAGGLNLEQVMNAVLAGLAEGAADFGIAFGLLVCSLRNEPPETSLRMAELAIDYRDRGCVGFDLAGEEAGHPPKDHIEAFHLIQRENFSITIHAGEGFGLMSIWQALQFCGAHRIGHATRLAEDIVVTDGEVRQLGRIAHFVRDRRIPLECCLSSNVDTGAAASIDAHPFRHFYTTRFRVTLNTDNRLMTGTTLTREYEIACEAFGLGLADVEKLVMNGMKSAFIHYDERCRIIYDVLRPAFARFDGRI